MFYLNIIWEKTETGHLYTNFHVLGCFASLYDVPEIRLVDSVRDLMLKDCCQFHRAALDTPSGSAPACHPDSAAELRALCPPSRVPA